MDISILMSNRKGLREHCRKINTYPFPTMFYTLSKKSKPTFELNHENIYLQHLLYQCSGVQNKN